MSSDEVRDRSGVAGTPDKKTLRGEIRAQRKARRRVQDDAARALEAERIARAAIAHLDSCPEARTAGWGGPSATVAAFRSTPSEPDTSALLDALHEREVRILVPRTQPDLSLDWHQLLPPDQRPGRSADSSESGPSASRSAVSGSVATDGAGASAQTPARSDAELPGEDDVADEGPALGADAVADISAMILPGLAVDPHGHRLGQGGGCYDRTLPRMRPDTCRAVLLFDAEILPAVPAAEHDQQVPAVLTPEAGWRDLTS